MRTVAVIQADLTKAQDESREISRRQSQLRQELVEARIAEANANPHPWLGKKVKQVRNASSWKKHGATKTVRGVLTIYGDGKYYRGGDSIAKGDLIVVTSSGLTAYRFDVREGGRPWELDQ